MAVNRSLLSGVHRGLKVCPSYQCDSASHSANLSRNIISRRKQPCRSSRTVVWRCCLAVILQFLRFSYRVMFKDFHHKKRAAVWYLSVIAMLMLVRLIGATTRSCLPRNACTISSSRVFLDVIGITRPAVSVQCAKRNTSTTPLEHWTDISITELKAMLTANNVQLFDVREPHELVETGKIACATNIPLRKVPEAFTMDPEEFEEQYNVKKPNKNDANIVFHCLAGVRSRAAMEAVHQIGFTKAKHYPGGFVEWTSQVDYTEKSNV